MRTPLNREAESIRASEMDARMTVNAFIHLTTYEKVLLKNFMAKVITQVLQLN